MLTRALAVWGVAFLLVLNGALSGAAIATTTGPEPAAPPQAGAAPREPEKAAAAPTPGAEAPDGAKRAPLKRLTSFGKIETHTPKPRDRRPELFPDPSPSKPTVGEALADMVRGSSITEGFVLPDFEAGQGKIEAGVYSGRLDEQTHVFQEDVRLELDQSVATMDELRINGDTAELRATGRVQLIQEAGLLEATELEYRLGEATEGEQPVFAESGASGQLSTGLLDARGLFVAEPGRAVQVERAHIDFGQASGEMWGVRGYAGAFYFGAEHVAVHDGREVHAEDGWISTCDHDPPHYRIRLKQFGAREGEEVSGRSAQLQIGKLRTPVYWPRYTLPLRGRSGIGFDFNSGHDAALGYYVNVGQQFAVSPDAQIGLRFFPTTDEGVGFGLEANYDFMETPSSRLFRGRGSIQDLYTTEDRGYIEFRHRQELGPDTVLLLQAEHWSDSEFYKDFFYEQYRNRTGPRTFADLTHTGNTGIARATVRKNTHGFASTSEALPEVAYHVLERRLAGRLYLSMDTVTGYYERDVSGLSALRSTNVARLSLDLDPHEGLSLTPFVEAEATWYSEDAQGDDSQWRLSDTVGATVQTRLHRAYDGALGFSGFKHVMVPSLTYSYRHSPSISADQTPRFDAFDTVYERSRLEGKWDNVFFGRDAESGSTWQVARLSLYAGTDFSNENRRADDFEVELDVRPRPWWGFVGVLERHSIQGREGLANPARGVSGTALELYERLFDRPYDQEWTYQYDIRYGDYQRALALLYYDDSSFRDRFNARIGFAYTDNLDEVFAREFLYGAGYRLTDNWSFSFEHRYDFEQDELYRQTYALRRSLHCWEAAIEVSERGSGWDISVAFNIRAFPGSQLKF